MNTRREFENSPFFQTQLISKGNIRIVYEKFKKLRSILFKGGVVIVPIAVRRIIKWLRWRLSKRVLIAGVRLGSRWGKFFEILVY